MALDVSKLHKATWTGGKLIAQCPACAEAGADKKGDHLFVRNQDGSGEYGCVMHPGPEGHAHRRRIFELAGEEEAPKAPVFHGRLRFASSIASSKAPAPAAIAKPVLPPPPPIKFPQDMRPPLADELCALADQRGIPSEAGLMEAAAAGHLFIGTLQDMPEGGENERHDVPAWIVTDSSRLVAQARRFDGRPWRFMSSKAWTLGKSQAAWPVGAADIGEKPVVFIAEGGPDFLCAWHLIVSSGLQANVAPVGMMGTPPIHEAALPLFKGKHVLIYADNDPQGQKASEKWAAQLYKAGALHVGRFKFSEALTLEDGRAPKDLNEAIAGLQPMEY
jgi:hypothetical protein